MAQQLKTFFSPALVRRLAADIARVESSFAARAFIEQASTGLEDLELLARGKHIANALAAHLPADYAKAVDVLLRSLGSEHASDELVGAGMAPFFYLPHTQFVAAKGLDHFELSMRAQYELTKRFSAESSIRPFIAKYPERTFVVLREWARDPNPHVRRLVSEGTRLRLPWAMRVAWLDENPDRVLDLLARLKDRSFSPTPARLGFVTRRPNAGRWSNTRFEVPSSAASLKHFGSSASARNLQSRSKMFVSSRRRSPSADASPCASRCEARRRSRKICSSILPSTSSKPTERAPPRCSSSSESFCRRAVGSSSRRASRWRFTPHGVRAQVSTRSTCW
jgi:3-methyladenine DNA glycosylase AlkC